MKKEELLYPYRDVRTLLFGKILPPLQEPQEIEENLHDKLYHDIHLAGQGNCTDAYPNAVQTFLTFGGYDAICVYPPKMDSKPDEWLHDIYRDKEHIIQMPSNSVIYHQVHLVSQHPDTSAFWTLQNKEYPFFLSTLIYGVNVGSLKELYEEAKLTELDRSALGSSDYERTIRLHLQKHCNAYGDNVKYAIYNGITVADVVVLWRANDLNKALEALTYIEYSGIARKTLTILGFPVDTNGQVMPCVTENLIGHMDKSIILSVQGSVRDIQGCMHLRKILSKMQEGDTAEKITQRVHALFQAAYNDQTARQTLRGVLQNGNMKSHFDSICMNATSKADFLTKTEPFEKQICEDLCYVIPDHHWTQSLGKSDFSATEQVSSANLANLLEAFREHHVPFSDSCWELLTDIKTYHPAAQKPWYKASQRPTDVMSRLYDDFQKLCDDSKGTITDLKQFSWFNALQELLGTHYYIDRHPVLHGPSYLIYYSLRIAHAYFAGQIPDYETPQKRLRLLNRSEQNLIQFVRNLDQLTEQLSRNDDAMLNNRSNTHTIHFSLPESALQFYHAFLRRIIHYVIQYDRDAGLLTKNFEYDFLLSPKAGSRFRFQPMFRTEHSDHDYQAGMVWPEKQAYILELPLESIFKPIDIFAPVVHESFHCFGDALRQRPLRKQCMALFIATNLLNAVGLGLRDAQSLCAQLARMICQSDENDADPYLTVSWQQLVRNTYQILETDTQEMLIQKFGMFVSSEILQRWCSTKDQLLAIDSNTSSFAHRITIVDAILKDCHTYFKECYADAMMIALLQLTPVEYLDRSRPELRRFHYEYSPLEIPEDTSKRISIQRTHLAQRFATVLAACSKQRKHLPYFTKEACMEAIRRYTLNADPLKVDDDCSEFTQILSVSYESLIDCYKSMPPASSLHPPAALNHVIDYLTESINLLYQDPPRLPIKGSETDDYTIVDLSRDFDQIIRNGNMFGEQFYDFIHNHHNEIRNASK